MRSLRRGWRKADWIRLIWKTIDQYPTWRSCQKLWRDWSADKSHPFFNGITLFPKEQSAYRRGHSTKTAVLKLISGFYFAAAKSAVSLLGLLNLSAAFDTVDHSTIVNLLQNAFGNQGTSSRWSNLSLKIARRVWRSPKVSSINHRCFVEFHKEVSSDKFSHFAYLRRYWHRPSAPYSCALISRWLATPPVF